MRRALFIILLICSCAAVFAQDAKMTASAPNVVAVGENFRLTYTVNAQGTGFKVPSFTDFSILSGPNTSSSSSIQITNGQMTQNVSFTYTYYLQATKEGKFSLEPAQITVGGKTIKSNALAIEVIKGAANTNANKNTQGGNQAQGNTQSSNVADIGNEDLFVRVNVDRTSMYQGEHCIATIKVYTKMNIAGFGEIKFPSFNGFLSQDIETPNQIALNRENVNGQIYNVGVMKKCVLFPQKSGELTIDPFELECIVQQKVAGRRSIWDDFFNSYQNVKKKVVSPSVKITVKPLPPNAPADFDGAVGTYNMEATLDKNNVKTNDAITLKIKISGNGNIKLIDPFKIAFPPDFETYDPKVDLKVNNTGGGASGSKTFEYLVIPRHAGQFKIDPVSFSYFDVNSKQYKTLSSGEFNINVEKGNEAEGTNVVSAGLSKEDVKYLGSDVRFARNKPGDLSKKEDFVFGSVAFTMTYPLSLVIFLVILFLRRKKIRENANALMVKNRRASKMARKRLKLAAVYLKQSNKEKFYDEILRALWGYMSDKLGIPVSDLSKTSALEAMEKQNIDKEMTDSFSSLVDTCEYARFAPAEGTGQMDKIYTDAISVISKLSSKLR